MTSSGIDRFFAYGRCENCRSKSELTMQLRKSGFNIDERNYSIRVLDYECFTFEFDCVTENEAHIEGMTASLAKLVDDAQAISIALATANIKFWLQITDSVQNRLHYFHNQCPDE